MPKELTLIFPHQLFLNHPAVSTTRPVYLLEDPLFFGNDQFHPLPNIIPHKPLLHRASLLAYKTHLESTGHKVRHLKTPDAPSTTSHLLNRLPLSSLKTIHLAEPTDDLLRRRLQRFADKHSLALHIHPTPNFLSPPDFLNAEFPPSKKPFMARFYQHQRHRMNILIEDNQPTGGQYSFDEDNRK
ncbi:MAG: cryptochrome/photolyase family protein, partial [Verrucomicrobiota bacterium]